MINHISLGVSDFPVSKEFFAKSLAPLGYKLLVDKTELAGFGIEDVNGKRDLWIAPESEYARKPSFSCLAFTAPNKEAVEDFYRAALEAGGIDNGAPGYRAQYGPGYYAAFVLSPNDNYNIEVVFDDPNQ